MQTPLWVPLLVAAIGLLGTLVGGIAGVLITQRRADAREAVAWRREDMLRTFDHRRTAYVDLISTVESLRRDLGQVGKERFSADFSAFRRALETVRIYGTPEVIRIATETELNAQIWLDALHGTPMDELDLTFSRPSATKEAFACRDSAEALLDKIRGELGIPGGSARVKPFGLDL